MITLPYETVYGRASLLFSLENYHSYQLFYLINVAGMPKRNPTHLLLVKEKHHVSNIKSFDRAKLFPQPQNTYLNTIWALTLGIQTQYEMNLPCVIVKRREREGAQIVFLDEFHHPFYFIIDKPSRPCYYKSLAPLLKFGAGEQPIFIFFE